jgi:hypothetical protein
VLKLLRTTFREEPNAAVAVARWDELRFACERSDTGKLERRFRRRAYERARDAALIGVSMRAAQLAARSSARHERRAPTTRFGALMRQPGNARR